MTEQTLRLPGRTAASVPVPHPFTTSSTDCLHFTNDEETVQRKGSSQSETSKILQLGIVYTTTKLIVFLG